MAYGQAPNGSLVTRLSIRLQVGPDGRRYFLEGVYEVVFGVNQTAAYGQGFYTYSVLVRG
jgi:hypothetical protein